MKLFSCSRYFLKDNQEKRTFVPPNLGELVAVWCESDGHWYRAITNHQDGTQLQVNYPGFTSQFHYIFLTGGLYRYWV